ncbi:MAG: BamA/TamA family outer membrane protein [Myxococcota bacterium]|nr:BamA/TamA family outer membrane protein [Myxococcota bacterium]
MAAPCLELRTPRKARFLNPSCRLDRPVRALSPVSAKSARTHSILAVSETLSAWPILPRWACVVTFASVVSFAVNAAVAAPPVLAPPPPADRALDPRRYELAGFPVLGGNSDIGIQFGAATTFTHFYDEARPYLWNLDLLLSGSLKDQNGLRLVQQSHVLRLDAPALFGGRVRIDTRASFQRTINAGYYGIGNATSVAPGEVGRRYQYVQQEGRLRGIARVHTGSPFDLALGASLRYEAPERYSGSRLAEDTATASPVAGATSSLLGGIAAGLMVDTRDSEFVTTRGVFYQAGVGWTVGSADRVNYGNASVVLAHYAPLSARIFFASRLVASAEFGRVPFYDLQQGGTFEPQYLLGGETGVRGVPQGRYAGLVKMVSNTEIRSTPFPRFRIFGQSFRIGTTAFFDAGRIWEGYRAISPADGRSIGLKFGVGGGAFLQWGEAAIFRIEAAYSPDAVDENPGFPLGLYVSDGLMF